MVRNTGTQLSRSCPPKTRAWEPECITCTGEMTWLSWVPVISSGRRETMRTIALIPPRQVSADWVRTTWWLALRTFIYIWREEESECYKFSSSCETVCIFQSWLKQCLPSHMPLIQSPFIGIPSVKPWGLYFLPLNLTTLVTMVVVTLGPKYTMQVIKMSHTSTLLSWEAGARLSRHTVRKLNQPWESSPRGEELRPPAHSPGRAASQQPAQACQPSGWAPCKLDPPAPSWANSTNNV